MTWNDIARYLPSFDPALPWLPQFFQLLLWGGTFACTVIFMRMLVTRWGDQNVTVKAIVLSSMLHALAGLWTTTIFLIPSRLQDDRKPIALREVIVDGGQPSREPTGDPVVPKSQQSPWDRIGVPPELSLERVRRDTKERPEDPETLDRDERLSAVPLPALGQPDLPEEAATPLLADDSPRAAEAATPDSLDGPAAEARPDVRASGRPGRSRRTETDSQPRPASSLRRRDDASTSLGTSPQPSLTADRSASPGPFPEVADESDGEGRGTGDIARPGAAVADPGKDAEGDGSKTSASGRFRRTSRRPGTVGGEDTEDARPAAGRPEGERGSESSLGMRLASTGRLMSGDRDSGPRALSPESDSPGRLPPRAPARYRLRGVPQRRDTATQFGATEASEKAVEAALVWMAQHQSPAGNWDPDGFSSHCPAGDRCTGLAIRGKDPEELPLKTNEREQRERSGIDADTGITGMVLLAYLGAGYTHLEGPHADAVSRGLYFLIRGQRADGFLGGKASYYAGIYCHGMATIALAEAYGMTQDQNLRRPLQLAVNYIVDGQSASDGGWRYEKGQVGDMSIFGWQMMALKSAQAAGIAVPKETHDRAARFLQQAALGDHGGLAGYGANSSDKRVRASMTAEAFFCRQLLGTPRTSASAKEAAAYLDQRLPTLGNYDLYYWYYATLAMYQHGGDSWERWNSSLQSSLLSLQKKDGHSAGSWDPYSPWGDYGGRLFSTAMSTLCLEVYYRFAPTAD